jgi:hypothetical protein
MPAKFFPPISVARKQRGSGPGYSLPTPPKVSKKKSPPNSGSGAPGAQNV